LIVSARNPGLRRRSKVRKRARNRYSDTLPGRVVLVLFLLVSGAGIFILDSERLLADVAGVVGPQA
jgi:hypothetical protein